MGTSKGYGGPQKALVPSWADGDGASPPSGSPAGGPGNGDGNGDGDGAGDGQGNSNANGQSNGQDSGNGQAGNQGGSASPGLAAVQTGTGGGGSAGGTGGSLGGARSSFTRYGSGGGQSKLGSAMRGYVSAVGASSAARRMGSVRATGGGLLSFAGDAAVTSVAASLEKRNLGHLVGRPAQEVFLGLVDVMCGAGGPIDEGISRQAMLEAVKIQLDAGVADFEQITADALKELFLDFVICSIEGKVISDIGAQGLKVSATVDGTIEVERQVKDFIAGATRDHVGELVDGSLENVNQGNLTETVTRIYEAAFHMLGEAGEDAE